jgi:hypothetical protein
VSINLVHTFHIVARLRKCTEVLVVATGTVVMRCTERDERAERAVRGNCRCIVAPRIVSIRDGGGDALAAPSRHQGESVRHLERPIRYLLPDFRADRHLVQLWQGRNVYDVVLEAVKARGAPALLAENELGDVRRKDVSAEDVDR